MVNLPSPICSLGHVMIENFKLKVFRVVADTRNYRRAADELHLTQPAVTAQIKSLEENLGIALLDRIGRDISLDPCWSHASAVCPTKLSPFPTKPWPHWHRLVGRREWICISALPRQSPCISFPSSLSRSQSGWPKLRLHITAGSTNEILHALSLHQIQLGLIESPAFRPDMKIEAFGEDELALIVPSDHRWARKSVLKAAELVQEPILLREVGSGMRRFVEEYLEGNGVLRSQLRTSIDINSNEGIIAAVEAGLGVGFVPWMALTKTLELGAIRTVPLDNGPIRRELSIALLHGPEPKGPAAQLLELVRASRFAPNRLGLKNSSHELIEQSHSNWRLKGRCHMLKPPSPRDNLSEGMTPRALERILMVESDPTLGYSRDLLLSILDIPIRVAQRLQRRLSSAGFRVAFVWSQLAFRLVRLRRQRWLNT